MKIKLFTTLVLFALIVTVGGVWATWNYASGEANITALATVTKNNITHGAESSNNVGIITINETPGTILSVTVSEKVGIDEDSSGVIEDDEKFDKNGDGVPDSVENYIPECYADGNVEVTFTPDGSAPAEYKDGVSLTCTLTAGEGSAFEFAVETLTLDSTNYGYSFDSATGACTWTLRGEDLGISFIDAYEDKAITSYADYTAFVTAVAKELDVRFALVVE